MKKPMSGKKLLSLCLALVLVLALLPGEVLAVDGGGGHCGDRLNWALDNGTLTISGSGAMDSYSEGNAPWYRQRTMIKAVEFASNDATSIGNYAFYGCTNLVSVTLSSSLTRIGTRAFSGCTALSQLKIRGSNTSGLQLPTSVTSIGSYAFENCSKLTNGISIPSRVTEISEGMFSGCSSLTTVGIPSGVISIGKNAFLDCRNLESIEIPSGVTNIGIGAFKNCTRLDPINGLTIPSGVTVLSDEILRGCSTLKKLTLPAGLTTIGNQAFSGCSSLPELTIPSGVTTIGSNAFDGCVGLEELSLPAGVTQIGTEAFANCTSLKTMTIPNGVTEIPTNAFYGDSALATIYLPASLTRIGDSAFNGCGLLKKVIYAGNREDWEKIQIETDNNALINATMNAANDPTVPVMVSATATPGKVTVIWESVVNETSYTVMRRQKKSSSEWTDWQNLFKTDLVDTLQYVDENVVAGTVYSYTVKANTTGEYDPVGLQVKAAAVEALAINSISADKTSARPGETITWTVSAQGNLDTRVYLFYVYNEETSKEAARSNNGAYAAKASFSYTPTAEGTYYVKAYVKYKSINSDTQKIESSRVTVSKTAASDTTVPAVPVLTGATASTGQITVKWNAVTNAAKYAVYRKTAGGSWNRLTNTVTGTTYTDKSSDLVSGTTYIYTVRAYVNGAWGGYDASGVSATAASSGSGGGSTASTVPVLTGATATTGQITVSWNAVSGASKYAVYRKIAGGSWNRLTNTVTGTTYTDKSSDLVSGTTYIYTVRAYVNGAWGGYDASGVSATAASSGGGSTASTVPVLTGATATTGQITVSWNAVSGATKYAVYRKTSGGSWNRLTNTVTGTAYTDKSSDLVSGTTYIYTVRAYANGAWGGYDASGVSATVASSGSSGGSTASTVPVLTGATATAGQITVSWNAVSGASKYAVYRKIAGGSWNRLTNTVTGTTYTDKSSDLVSGTTYIYTVRAYVNGAWGGYDANGIKATAVAAAR